MYFIFFLFYFFQMPTEKEIILRLLLKKLKRVLIASRSWLRVKFYFVVIHIVQKAFTNQRNQTDSSH